MANKEKKENGKVNNKIILAVVGVIILVIVIVLVVLNLPKDDVENKEKPNKPSEGEVVSDEKTVEKEYGFSKEDAIKVAKGIFQSDNYEFDAKVREDNMWIVTVKNTDNDETYTIIVNPNDGTHEFVTE